jgi:hypothetical protein
MSCAYYEWICQILRRSLWIFLAIFCHGGNLSPVCPQFSVINFVLLWELR